MPRKKKITEEKKMENLLETLPALTLESKNVDPLLAKVVFLMFLSLVDIKKISYKNILIEENRYNSTFLYYVENKKKKLSGYIGRNKDTQQIMFLIVDQSRFHWAEKEGFINNKTNPNDRQFVFEQIGVLRPLDGLKSFINFISGAKNFEFEGEYILANR